jgi:hypothetical protein
VRRGDVLTARRTFELEFHNVGATCSASRFSGQARKAPGTASTDVMRVKTHHSLNPPAYSCANEIFVIADVQLPVDEDHGVDVGVGVGLGSVGAGATEGVGPVKAVASFVLASPSNFFSSA